MVGAKLLARWDEAKQTHRQNAAAASSSPVSQNSKHSESRTPNKTLRSKLGDSSDDSDEDIRPAKLARPNTPDIDVPVEADGSDSGAASGTDNGSDSDDSEDDDDNSDDSDDQRNAGEVDTVDAKKIAQDYKEWRAASVHIYSQVHEIALEWPSLTFEWQPTKDPESQVAVIGTHTNKSEGESILLIEPKKGRLPTDYVRSYTDHEEEVNRARFCPHDPTIVVDLGPEGLLSAFHINNDSMISLAAKAQGHADNGYGVVWDPRPPLKKGVYLLATGADSAELKLWQYTKSQGKFKLLDETTLPDSINDVAWNAKGQSHQSPDLAVACENGKIYLYDVLKTKIKANYKFHFSKRPISFKAHDEGVNCVAFSPFAPHMIATASSDSTIALFDTRGVKPHAYPQHILIGHEGSVTSLKWSPLLDGILASGGRDRRVILWDIHKIGCEQDPEEASEAAPELIFMHGGHTAPVSDFDWHPACNWLLGSVGEDNVCQVWSPSDAVINGISPPPLPEEYL